MRASRTLHINTGWRSDIVWVAKARVSPRSNLSGGKRDRLFSLLRRDREHAFRGKMLQLTNALGKCCLHYITVLFCYATNEQEVWWASRTLLKGFSRCTNKNSLDACLETPFCIWHFSKMTNTAFNAYIIIGSWMKNIAFHCTSITSNKDVFVDSVHKSALNICYLHTYFYSCQCKCAV